MDITLPKVLALLLVIVTFGARADFTLTFMEEPCINLVNITDEYADYGVEFADVYRYVDSRDPWKDYSPTQGCGISYGLFGGGSFGNGLIMFEYPTPYATLDWWTITGTIYADAYDSDDNLVDSFSGSGSGTSTLTGSASISYVTFHDSGGYVQVANITYVRSIEVAIDIKFCSDPNAFNCKKNGVLPVTIFGTADFDVADIDIDTLQLCLADGVTCTNAPRDTSTFDRGTPGDAGVAQCDFDPATGEELDFFIESDDFLDLDAAFEASEVKAILGGFCDDAAKGDVSQALIIVGETYDGIPIYSVPADDNTGIDRLVKANK